jgi:hypothetical protein
MNQNKIRIPILILALLFLALPTVTAHIDIIDVGHYNAARWNDIEGLCGYVDYQNVANYTIGGAILVFVDGEIVAGKILNMGIRYVAGFRCSPIKTLEFPITEAEGDHIIVVYIRSMNASVESAYEYYIEGAEGVIEGEESEIEEDWLTCGGGVKNADR